MLGPPRTLSSASPHSLSTQAAAKNPSGDSGGVPGPAFRFWERFLVITLSRLVKGGFGWWWGSLKARGVGGVDVTAVPN